LNLDPPRKLEKKGRKKGKRKSAIVRGSKKGFPGACVEKTEQGEKVHGWNNTKMTAARRKAMGGGQSKRKISKSGPQGRK